MFLDYGELGCAEHCRTVGYERVVLRASAKRSAWERKRSLPNKNNFDDGGNEHLQKVEAHQINFDKGGKPFLQKGCYRPFFF
jgi:hypothetical protein